MRPELKKILLGSALMLGGLTAGAQGLENVVVEEYHTITQADADYYNIDLAGGSYALVPGMKCYRIYLDMAPNYKLLQVYGAPGTPSPNPLDITTTTNFWNDDDVANDELAPQTRRLDEGAMFDSFITINRAGISGGTAGCGTNTEQFGVLRSDDTDGDLTTCGSYPGFTGNDGNIPGTGPNLTYNLGLTMDFAAFTGNGSTFTCVDESWTTLPASQGVDPAGTNRMLIAQVTTDGQLSFHLNVQLSDPNQNVETYVWNQAGPGEVVSPLLTYPAVTDCEGVVGGSALPGTGCDDGDFLTVNDMWDANCVCTGDPVDCLGVPNGNALPGTACDDQDAGTYNDLYDANCNCAGTPYDCPALMANIGDACDDGDPNTSDDVVDANCVCVGISIFDCPNLMADIGDACDDGDAGTYGDVVDANCVCTGTPYDCPALMANIGDTCDDGDPNTSNDVVDANCVCAGTSTFDCPNLMANIGDACDD
ncbi:MAG: hypothetical protein KDB97_12070, partial [Flavobacteriales bacterium]|nr:hypothetical protein [Flavobacteriales bacterium]